MTRLDVYNEASENAKAELYDGMLDALKDCVGGLEKTTTFLEELAWRIDISDLNTTELRERLAQYRVLIARAEERVDD